MRIIAKALNTPENIATLIPIQLTFPRIKLTRKLIIIYLPEEEERKWLIPEGLCKISDVRYYINCEEKITSVSIQVVCSLGGRALRPFSTNVQPNPAGITAQFNIQNSVIVIQCDRELEVVIYRYNTVIGDGVVTLNCQQLWHGYGLDLPARLSRFRDPIEVCRAYNIGDYTFPLYVSRSDRENQPGR